MRIVWLVMLSMACTKVVDETDVLPETDDTEVDTDVVVVDADKDGYPAATDCDDADASVHPDASEIPYDTLDNDCDPTTVDDDLDGDGYPVATDCDDTNSAISPAASDAWYDGVDSNCDGANDYDADGDGFMVDGGDCDDADVDVRPSAVEVCDNGQDDNCDGSTNDCGWSGDISPTSSSAKIAGADVKGRIAEYMGKAGDLDGDGNADLLIGSAVTQLVWVFAGGGTGTSRLVDAMATVVVTDGDGVSGSGKVMLGPGDLDGDGHDDLLVGAPETGTGAGSVFLFPGPLTGTLETTDASAEWTAEGSPDRAGSAIAALFGSDGSKLVAIGAPNHAISSTINAGRIYLVSGAAGGALGDATLINGETDAGYAAGSALAGLDYDGDGASDLAAGAPQYFNTTSKDPRGAAYMLLGPFVSGTSLADADGRWFGESVNAHAASVLANGGDLDGDGRDDLLVGAIADTTGPEAGGAAYILLGGGFADTSLNSAAARCYAETGGVELGYAMDGVGDIDGNGVANFIISDWRYTTRSHTSTGRSYLFDGAPSGLFDLADATAVFTGEADEAHLGASVVGAGDMNGDGLDDFALGAPYDNELAVWGGAAYIFYGASW